MFSIPDLAIVGAIALILFGPDRLPSVARKVGQVMREVQNTSQAFIREMERAADEHDAQEDLKRATDLSTAPAPQEERAGGGAVHEGPARDDQART
jgi:sec-independent protein translocase protein TatA